MKHLIVDLDGSLIKTDLLYEGFLSFFKNDLLAPFKCLYILMFNGLPALKKYIYLNSNISLETLPFNENVIKYIYEWKKENDGKVILCSASWHEYLKEISSSLKIFDDFYGTKNKNLKGIAKLKKIRKEGIFNYDYIGDSKDDFVLWKNAKTAIIVDGKKKIRKKAALLNSKIVFIDANESVFKLFISQIRIHQWVKNILVFIPAFLAGAAIESFYICILAFFAFSFTASCVYIFNDLLDVQSDRKHSKKKFRPIASGSISIKSGAMLFAFMAFFAITLISQLNIVFQLCLIFYVLINFIYTTYFKKIPILDIFVLALFYIIRVISGAVAIPVDISNWLITFSAFFFLFLGGIKRWVELEDTSSSAQSGRGYKKVDIHFFRNISYFSGLISVLVICLYIDSKQAVMFYGNSISLWAIPIILLYWIMDILFVSERGEMSSDPVSYAIKNKVSYICLLLIFIIFLFSL